MKLTVTSLPSHFKPYPFKSFRMDAIDFDQSQELGADPSLEDIRRLVKALTHDEIDTSLLVPIDLKYLIAMLAFHAFPNQTWTLSLKCPHCNDTHTKVLTMKDFPPIPSFEDSDPYPLTIDDGRHVFALGYAKTDFVENIDKVNPKELIQAHIISVDGSEDPGAISKALGEITDFGVISVMLQAIKKYFQVETYAEMECPKCKEKYRVKLSAVEVTQYTPFRDAEAAGKYKTNFRL